MSQKVLIFDLDNTLYYAGNLLEKLEEHKVYDYFSRHLNLSLSEAKAKVQDIRSRYNYDTDAFGVELPFKASDYMQEVCDVDISMLPPDRQLNDLLSSLQNPKYILSDNIKKHVLDTLAQIQISPQNFLDIFCAEDLGFVFKNTQSGFQKFLTSKKLLPEDCIIFEDSKNNLKVANSLGIGTVYVGPDWQNPEDFIQKSYPDIKTALKNLYFS